MDPYEEERLAVEKAQAAAELRMELEEAVRIGRLYTEDDEDGPGRCAASGGGGAKRKRPGRS